MKNKIVIQYEEIYQGHKLIVISYLDFTGEYHNCGYVQLNQKVDADSYNDLPYDVHGGLTFSGNLYGEEDEILYSNVVGFDCAHGEDNIHKQNVQYVINECRELIDQINSDL